MDPKYKMLLNNSVRSTPVLENIIVNYMNYDFEKVHNIILDALKTDFDNFELHLKLAIILRNKKEYHSALKEISFIIENFSNQLNHFKKNTLTYNLKLIESFISGKTEKTEVRHTIIDQYLMLPLDSIPNDLIEYLIYIMYHPLENFPDNKIYEELKDNHFEITYDTTKEMYYILHNNKKLYYYFKDLADIEITYQYILMEQASSSPHRYLTNNFTVKKGDVIVDIGAAEANFTLDSIELCEKAYIVEAEPQWQPALKNTFEPWKEKVHFIQKFISDEITDTTTTLDALLHDQKVDLLKLDVEGFELKVLEGAKEVIKNNKQIKLAVCTYHKTRDAIELSEYLLNLGFQIEFSNGYMIFSENEQLEFPYFKKGLLRAWRE